MKKSRPIVLVLFVKNVSDVLGLVVVVFLRYVPMPNVTRLRSHLVKPSISVSDDGVTLNKPEKYVLTSEDEVI